MKLTEALKLTRLEFEILKHRLEVPDAIADALEDLTDYHELIGDVCEKLAADDFSKALMISPRLCELILVDCVDGSTYAPAAIEESTQKQNAIFRAGDSLAEKVGRHYGCRIVFPTY